MGGRYAVTLSPSYTYIHSLDHRRPHIHVHTHTRTRTHTNTDTNTSAEANRKARSTVRRASFGGRQEARRTEEEEGEEEGRKAPLFIPIQFWLRVATRSPGISSSRRIESSIQVVEIRTSTSASTWQDRGRPSPSYRSWVFMCRAMRRYARPPNGRIVGGQRVQTCPLVSAFVHLATTRAGNQTGTLSRYCVQIQSFLGISLLLSPSLACPSLSPSSSLVHSTATLSLSLSPPSSLALPSSVRVGRRLPTAQGLAETLSSGPCAT